MTETKLPDELEEQAMLHALGVLDVSDRQAFLVRLQGESNRLCQTVTAYQAVTDALTSTVMPVVPSATLRERLVDQIVVEATREVEQFEQTANTLALNLVSPIKPREVLRERLLSRLEGESEVRLDVRDSIHAIGEMAISVEDKSADENRKSLPQGAGFLSVWLRSCWQPVWNFVRTIFARAVVPRPSTNGLTFIRASEGPWRGMAPGVTAKILSFDQASQRVTTLLRFAPSTRYAPHRHTAVEELFVLEGGCRIAGHAMTVGDYHRAEAGTEHYDTSTDDGCLLLVISSPQNEML